MARKYRKIGLRRDQNLADLDNRYAALSNLLNSLAAPGETFIPEDLFVINNLRNTNITNNDFAQIGNLKLTYTDETNTEQLIQPIVRLEDRIENYKTVAGSPPMFTGGDGIKAKFIPGSNISTDIGPTTPGSLLFNQFAEIPYYGPFNFWDNGVFEFENLIYSEFEDPYGMIQWEGYFAPAPGDQNLTISYATTGLLLIEQDPFDNESWETLKSIYASSRTVVVTSVGEQTGVSSVNVGDSIRYLSIGDKLANEEIYIIDINVGNQTITLDNSINLLDGDNLLTFEFNIGQEVRGLVRLRQSYLNDKIKIRITVWWPNPNNVDVRYESKNINFFYPNSIINIGSIDALTYNFFYSEYDRTAIPNELSVEYFIQNYLSTTNSKTDYNLTVNGNVLVRYSPPLTPLEVLGNTSLRTFTYQGLGKIFRTNTFANVSPGDYILRTSNYTKSFLIKEKSNNSTIYIDPFVNSVVENINDTFDGYIVKGIGLVGVFKVLGTQISVLDDNDFNRSLIQQNQLLLAIDTTSGDVTGIFRITTYNYETGEFTVDTISNTGETIPADGIVIIYKSSALEDLSKLVYCKGVVGKEVNAIVNLGATKIYLKDVNGLTEDMYVQLTGSLLSTTQLVSIGSDTGGDFITISQPTQSEIKEDVTLTFSPDSVNREICVIPLNTAPPFAGTETGLITQTGNESLAVNKISVDNLIFKETQATAIPNNTALTVSKSLEFTTKDGTYRFLIKWSFCTISNKFLHLFRLV